MVYIEKDTLNADGKLTIADIMNQIEQMVVMDANDQLLTACEIDIKDAEIDEGKYINISMPYNDVNTLVDKQLSTFYWDCNTEQWSESGIVVTNQNTEENYLSFRSSHTSIFAILQRSSSKSNSTQSNEGGGLGGAEGCFIATAAFGSPPELHIALLREFRNRFSFWFCLALHNWY